MNRDDGFWKPPGKPLTEAIRRLGLPAENCWKVGDSHYDAAAARAAGCGSLIIHYDTKGKIEADLSLPTVSSFLRYPRRVL